jgi:gliding motility-associated-like protein
MNLHNRPTSIRRLAHIGILFFVLLTTCSHLMAQCAISIQYSSNDTICSKTGAVVLASVSGGAGTYTWTGDSLAIPITSSTLNYTPKVGGKYRFRVVYTDGTCTDSAFANIVVNELIATAIQATQPTCGKANGSIQFGVNSASVTIVNTILRNGIVIQSGAANFLYNAGAGSYVMVSHDPITGCTSDTTSPVVLGGGGLVPAVLSTQITPEICKGDKQGSVIFTLSNCTGGCNYKWSYDTTLNSPSATGLAGGSYTFSVSLGICNTWTYPVVVPGPTTALKDTILTQDEYCGSSNGSVQVNATGGWNKYSYLWSTGATGASINSLTAGTVLTVTVTDSLGCSVSNTATIGASNSGIQVTLSTTPDYCGSHNGTAHVRATLGTRPYRYLWYDASTVDSVVGLSGGTLVTVSVTDSLGCRVTDTATIKTDTGSIKVRVSIPDTICSQDFTGNISVTASGSRAYVYSWSNGSNRASQSGIAVGTYIVTVTSIDGCVVIDTARVLGYNDSLRITGDSVTYEGQPTQLKAITVLPTSNIKWLPYITQDGSATVTVAPIQTTKYYANIAYGTCIARDSITVTVLHDTSLLSAPNVFTPNADGVNDYFYLHQEGAIKSLEVFIFDRWGSKVYQSTNMDFKWDGTNAFADNTPLPMGVYTYVVEYFIYNSPDKKTLQGNASLVK